MEFLVALCVGCSVVLLIATFDRLKTAAQQFDRAQFLMGMIRGLTR